MTQNSFKSHLFLKKESILINSFYKGRGRNDQTKSETDEEKEDEVSPQKNYAIKKQALLKNLSTLRSDYTTRRASRNLPVETHVEYVLIHFQKTFKDDLPKVFSRYGLTPVNLNNLN